MIRLLALDVDGVMTDGRLIYHSDGTESKAFFVGDGVGIKRVIDGGIHVVIITGRGGQAVERRARELGIVHVLQGRNDKWTALQELMAVLGVEADKVAYMGDDLPDIEAIKHAGIGIAPANAVDAVKAVADKITQRRGGDGAVREACDWLLATMQGKC